MSGRNLNTDIDFYLNRDETLENNIDNFTDGDDMFRRRLRLWAPMPVYETLIREVPEVFPIYVTLGGDTIREPVYIPVPITQKEYSTDNYRAWVSGYKASLDSVWVYPETKIIREKPRRWGIGVIAGYGIGRNGLSPYVGVGGYWRVW